MELCQESLSKTCGSHWPILISGESEERCILSQNKCLPERYISLEDALISEFKKIT